MATTAPALHRRGPYGLTKLQHATLLVVQELAALDGQPPTLDEIARELDLSSRAQAHRSLCALRSRGYLDWLPCQRRSLRVLVAVPLPAELREPRPALEILKLPAGCG